MGRRKKKRPPTVTVLTPGTGNASLTGAAATIQATGLVYASRVQAPSRWLSRHLPKSLRWVAGFEWAFFILFGFTMIQVDEYLAADFSWALSGLVLIAKAITWGGIENRPKLTRLVRLVLIIVATSICGSVMVWTYTKKADKAWSILTARRPDPATPTTPAKPPTLSDLFKNDFGNTMKFTDDSAAIRWQSGELFLFPIKTQVYADFPAKAQFVGFYIPTSPKTYEASLRLVDAVHPTINDLPKRVGVRAGYRDEGTALEELTFSGRVLLYHEDFLSIPQKAEIIRAYALRHFDVQFRGPDYLSDQIISWHHQRDAKKAQ